MTEVEKPGLLDLEKELTCSICTEVLYQPLTLLDCLHTFCGSCLKEWFAFQATRASRTSPNPLTCPSCRAAVRETRPNATVTTLLEMYIQANPGRARTDKEKEDIRQKYTPGENVLPKIRRKKDTAEDVEDRRMVEEARELSLREVGIRGQGYERGVRHRAREGQAAASTQESQASVDEETRARQMNHQASLRSMLSSSDLGDHTELEEEILRQIMEEGILDGIDLDNLNVSQEDELSERIAEAYRRKHRHRQRQRSRSATRAGRRAEAGASQSRNTDPAAEQIRHRRTHSSSNPVERPPNASHPPVSRPHLLEAYPTAQGRRRRTSSEDRRQTSPTPVSHSRDGSETHRQAARSATDLSSRPSSSETQRQASRSATDLSNRPAPHNMAIPRPNHISGQARRTGESERLRPRTRDGERPTQGRQSRSPQDRAPTTDTARRPLAGATPTASPNIMLHGPQDGNQSSSTSAQANPAEMESQSSSSEAQGFVEPSISCNRCGKAQLEYELHFNCSRCDNGSYNLCLSCHRTGKGCLHWYGFGTSAIQRYERSAPLGGYPPGHELPHRLQGHQYLRPPTRTLAPAGPSRSTTSDPSQRLQSGPFCSKCLTFSPACYWQCSICNEGEYGFCNTCVNTGKCCTHPLLPVALTSYLNTDQPPNSASATSFHPKPPTSLLPLPNANSITNRSPDAEYTPLTISTHCDNCTYPIPPSTTRYHCLQCNSGDYDLCTACYQKFLKRGAITADNGPRGRRLCPRQGHRMIVVGFEDSEAGQRRIVVEDLVGGVLLLDSDGDGSGGGGGGGGRARGMRVLALWGWWPQEGPAGANELAFPKWAEIRECEDITGDWYTGVYCGDQGLFPSAYVRFCEGYGIRS